MPNLTDFNPNNPRDLEAVPQAVINQIRLRCQHETYYLAKQVLGFNLLRPSVHGPLCGFLDTCDALYRLIQMPRSFFKTTTTTVAHRMKDILKHPALRILIVGNTDTNAQKHLAKIKIQFETNALLRWLFRDIIWENPRSQAPVWSKQELYLPAASAHGEPTLDAIGAGSAVVSRHYDIINADDLIADEEMNSPTSLAKVIEWFTGLESLWIPWVAGEPDYRRLDIPSTFWLVDDVYAFAEKYYGRGQTAVPTGPFSYMRGDIAVFRRAARGDDGESIFPEAITTAQLDRLQATNPERYAAQYANNPYSADVAYFKREYLKFYNWRIVDRVLTAPRADGYIEVVKVEDLDIISFCDPAAGGTDRFKASRAAVITTGVNRKTGRIYILDCFVKQCQPDVMVDEIIRQNSKWLPREFSIEANGLQRMIKPWLDQRVQNLGSLPVPYTPYIPRSKKESDARIKGLQPMFRAGQIVMQEGFSGLIDEYLSWPRGKWDALDCLAQGVEKWGISYDDVWDEEMWEYEWRLREMRNVATGY